MTDSEAQKGTWLPSKQQAAVLQAAMETGINRTIQAVCKSAHVPRRTFYNWLDDDPDFARAWEYAWKGSIKRHSNSVFSAIAKKAQAGDINAAKLFFDLSGENKQRHVLEGGLEIAVKGYVGLNPDDWPDKPDSSTEPKAG